MIDKSLLALGTLLAFAQSPAPIEDNTHNAYADRQHHAQQKAIEHQKKMAHQTHKSLKIIPKKETA